MANYYCTWRSNQFRVKDLEAFRADMALIDAHIEAQSDGRITMHQNNGESGIPGFESFPVKGAASENEEQQLDEADFIERVSEHLAEGEVAVFIEAGAEKLRYVGGTALAVNDQGEIARVTLDDIYEQARGLTDRPDAVTHASF